MRIELQDISGQAVYDSYHAAAKSIMISAYKDISCVSVNYETFYALLDKHLIDGSHDVGYTLQGYPVQINRHAENETFYIDWRFEK